MPDVDLQLLRDLEAAAEAAVVQAVEARDRIRALVSQQEQTSAESEARRRRRRFRIVAVPVALSVGAAAIRAAAEDAPKTAAVASSGVAVVAIVAAVALTHLGGPNHQHPHTYAAPPPRASSTAGAHRATRPGRPPTGRPARPGATPAGRGRGDAAPDVEPAAVTVKAPHVIVKAPGLGLRPVRVPPAHVVPPVHVTPPVRMPARSCLVDLRPALPVSLLCPRRH